MGSQGVLACVWRLELEMSAERKGNLQKVICYRAEAETGGWDLKEGRER